MPKVTLTFDNGPTEVLTPRVLDVLAERGILATFFVVGEQIARPKMRAHAERAVGEGHWIGNHGFTHSRPLGQFGDPTASIGEIARCEEEIGALAHRPDPLIRPFCEGHVDRRVLNPAALRHLEEGGFTMVTFRHLAGDWEGADWPDRAIDQVAEDDHSLVVLHDRQFAVDDVLQGGALPGLERFLDLAEAAGSEFVQDPPDDCVLLRAGRPADAIEQLVSATPIAREAPDFPPIEPGQLGLPA